MAQPVDNKKQGEDNGGRIPDVNGGSHEKTANTDGSEHKNVVLAVGGASFTDPCITGVSTYNNAEFMINAINKICGKENSIIIAEKNFESTAIDVTDSQLTFIMWLTVLIIPFVVVVCGVVVYVMRRNK